VHRYRFPSGRRCLVIESGIRAYAAPLPEDHGSCSKAPLLASATSGARPACRRSTRRGSDPREEEQPPDARRRRASSFDVVGWTATTILGFNINDFEPRVGRVHLPPPTHQTFEGDGFVVLLVLPAPVRLRSPAVPVPYVHSNVMSDEVLYYASAEFMSARHRVRSVTSTRRRPARADPRTEASLARRTRTSSRDGRHLPAAARRDRHAGVEDRDTTGPGLTRPVVGRGHAARTPARSLIDYAGLFRRPGSTWLLRTQLRRVPAGPHAWMLGRLIVPAQRLEEFDAPERRSRSEPNRRRRGASAPSSAGTDDEIDRASPSARDGGGGGPVRLEAWS